MFKLGRNSELFMSREIVEGTSVDLRTLERSGYSACTGSPPESTPYFTNIICIALFSVEMLESVEDTPLRKASLRSWGGRYTS